VPQKTNRPALSLFYNVYTHAAASRVVNGMVIV
jgi:hypothetical protein